jgi:hypothetical protein
VLLIGPIAPPFKNRLRPLYSEHPGTWPPLVRLPQVPLNLQ